MKKILCPKCKSDNIKDITRIGWELGRINENYKCDDCGYEGKIYALKEMKKVVKK